MLLVLLATACTSRAEPSDLAKQVKLVSAFANLKFERPLYFTSVPDGSGRVVVLEQAGRVSIFKNDPKVTSKQKHIALDITDKVLSPLNGGHGNNEEGLLGLAFDPKFKQNGLIFIHYTADDPRREVISRFEMDDKRRNIKPGSEKVLLKVKEPWGNHNGGTVEFGPEGYLYLSFGDGGAGGDPHKNGQNLGTLLGTILRIDVDHRENGKPYAIPDDNPFVNRKGARGEIWAYGLRNAWRFSFDPKTKELWAGDVGQNKWEEVDLITKGGNYGWRYREGTHKFKGVPKSVDRDSLIEPIVDYSHHTGVSVTGGYVYRGDNLPALEGMYIYCDYGSGIIWALDYAEGKVKRNVKIAQKRGVPSFGRDAEGELYLTCFDGKIYRLAPASK